MWGGGVGQSLIEFMLNPPAEDGSIWTKETASSQLGCDDGNISVFLGQSSVLMLMIVFKCCSLERMTQLNLIRDLLYSSINGEKDLGLRRNYEGIQYEEQMKL